MNQELFYIQPVKTEYYGEMMTAQKGLGKVAKGQKVLIKVESYPSQEFGWINGTVDYISSMPNRRDSFIVKVILPRGLRTNFNQDIYFRNNLSGSGDIITRDRRLIERLLGDLSVIIKQQQ
jgi:HlyD family secretion protein